MAALMLLGIGSGISPASAEQVKCTPEATSESVTDAKSADAAIAKALRMPTICKERHELLFQAIHVFKSLGDQSKVQQIAADIEKSVRMSEQEKNLTAAQIKNLAGDLVTLSNVFAPAMRWQISFFQQPISVVADTASKDTEGVREEDFNAAEGYRLRAISLVDRLPPKDPTRIQQHREIVGWYKHYGKQNQYEAQLHKLGNLFGTQNVNYLFPPPGPPKECLGCGRG